MEKETNKNVVWTKDCEYGAWNELKETTVENKEQSNETA